MSTLRTLLVANRGEIARRITRTARAMGMRVVAVYVDADADAPFVSEADDAVRLASGTYLDPAGIVAAATATGADAVHPGYGFLSENAGFARAVLDAGLVWVGPGPEAISAMGDKLAAKRLAVEAGVPTLPSAEGVDGAAEVGYPLLVKAAAGGGGKGMRIVHTPDDLLESVEAAQREALGGFGDATVFLERYVPRARHIEIQILGDTHGNLVHLGERECSIQRRHQKVVEEAPSPVVDPAMRAAMGEAALALARRLGYVSAGTVEFLVDDAPGPDGRRPFYFLEVNTRLQVEHPVTEAVTGLDLVREQLRIAAGAPLGYGQHDVTLTGHAVEVRLYAEDPANGFLPATGTLTAFAPAAEPAVRWDAGVRQGSVVGTSFDPMLAKVIAHAPTRAEAALRLALALERTHLGGVITNRDFLVATLRHDAYLAGDTTTAFINEHAPARAVEPAPERLARVAAGVALWVQGTNRASARVLEYLPSGWRNARMPDERVALDLGGERIEVRYRIRRDGRFRLGDGTTATIHQWSPAGIDATVGDRRVRLQVTRGGSAGPAAGDRLYVHDGAVDLDVVVLPRFTVPGSDAPTGGLTAPMPGKVLDVRVAVGDTVSAGQVLLILEAMKMEHRITAPTDGTVTAVSVAAGDQLERGAALLHVEEAG